MRQAQLLVVALALFALGAAVTNEVASGSDSDLVVGLLTAAPLYVVGTALVMCALLMGRRR